MEEKEAIITNYELTDDDKIDNTIRPETLDEYIGQTAVKENIRVFIEAAKMRNEPLDHVLLYGPPGLGKTTLAFIIAHEMGTNIKTASGPSIEKAGDLAAILSSLEPGDVLFIDEIHRMPRFIEEILYPAMEDFTLDIIVGSEGNTRNIKIDLPPFTLVGATTRAGDLSAPLRDRFGIVSKLEYYTTEELTTIVKRTAKVLNTTITDDAALELAKRSRGTPRIANRLFKRVSDFALVEGKATIDKEATEIALDKLKVDKYGLDNTDHELLLAIINKFNGGPVGIDALSSTIGEEATTIEDVYEPYLLQTGLLKRTTRGRTITSKAYKILGLKENTKEEDFKQVSFEDE
jgi:Holliday junction DNA helicase RuvB